MSKPEQSQESGENKTGTFWRTHYGINFYGVRFKKSDDAAIYDALAAAIDTAARAFSQRHSPTVVANLFRDSEIPMVRPFWDLLGGFFDRLQGTTSPHALQMSHFAPIDFFNIIGAEAGIAKQSLSCLVGQQWDPPLLGPDRFAKWLDDHFGQLSGYLTQLIRGKFVDRNGTKLAFSLAIEPDKVTPGSIPQLITNVAAVSPQVAGELVYALVEFLGDKHFHVKAYDPDAALPAHQQYACWLSQPPTISAAFVVGDAEYIVRDPGGDEDENRVVGAVIAHAARTTEGSVKGSVGTIVRGA